MTANANEDVEPAPMLAEAELAPPIAAEASFMQADERAYADSRQIRSMPTHVI